MFVFEKICFEIQQVCLLGQVNLRLIAELCKIAPVLLKRLEKFFYHFGMWNQYFSSSRLPENGSESLSALFAQTFIVIVGRRRGRTLSPLLFIVCMNWKDSHEGVTGRSRRINRLLFADDWGSSTYTKSACSCVLSSWS